MPADDFDSLAARPTCRACWRLLLRTRRGVRRGRPVRLDSRAAARLDAGLAAQAGRLGDAFGAADPQELLVDYTRLFLDPSRRRTAVRFGVAGGAAGADAGLDGGGA